MKRLLNFVATIFLTGCSATACIAPVAQSASSQQDYPYVAGVNGEVFIVITETPSPEVVATPAMRVAVVPYGSTPPPESTCWFYGGSVPWRRLGSGKPCGGTWPSQAYAAIPTPSMRMQVGNDTIYPVWEGCHWGYDEATNTLWPEADGGGVCPWTTAYGYTDERRHANQVNP